MVGGHKMVGVGDGVGLNNDDKYIVNYKIT